MPLFSAVSICRLREISAAGDGSEIRAVADAAIEKFSAAMADDLNTAEALAQLHDLAREANRLADSGKLSAAGAAIVLDAFRKFDRIFGCLDVDAAPAAEEAPAELVALAEQRAAARKEKNFAESDRLRDAIAAAGFLIEDMPGNKWRLKKK